MFHDNTIWSLTEANIAIDNIIQLFPTPPLSMNLQTGKVDLLLPVTKYRIALSILVNECQRFAIHPLAWLCYLAYTIYGHEGYIASSDGGPRLDCHAETIHPGKYYYVSQEPPSLLDPDLMEDRMSDSSMYTTRRHDFQQRVVDRDGTCILTGNAESVEVCHIVPHAKGDQYIINVVNNRTAKIVDPPLDGINDIRNGILLHPAFHAAFGSSRVAFLHTPNAVMDVYDVERVQQPNSNQIHASSDPGRKRLTFQHFNTNDSIIQNMAPHNCDARLSDDANWPSDLIFDAAYGIAALKRWGTKRFMKFIRKSTRDMYYNIEPDNDEDGNEDGLGGHDEDGGRGGHGIHDEGDRGEGTSRGDKGKRANRAERWAKRRDGGGQAGSITHDTYDTYDLLLGIWSMTNARDKAERRKKVETETRDRVEAWLDS